MKDQIELRLIPVPGQKSEFLATLVPTTTTTLFGENNNKLTVVLENYTRDEWASDTSTRWQSCQLQSIDGRNKLPGFVDYLRQRKKSAYGRLGSSRVLVVSHKQASSRTIACRVAGLDTLPSCPLKVLPSRRPSQEQTTRIKINTTTTTKANPTKPKKKGSGLLGNLVGAQKRTNQQVITANKAATTNNASKTISNTTSNTEEEVAKESSAAKECKTSAQVLMEFRQEMEQQMLDFDIATDPVLKVKVSLASKTSQLSEEEKLKEKVTMEVLKYIVYEQAEEINEEWIAHKEPSEFMDEVVIAIYKEGEAPDDVIEDINRAELPEEVKGQQRAMQQQQQQLEKARALKLQAETQRMAMQQDDSDDFAVLNTNKRDRRTIEEIQMEMNAQKRQRND